MFNDDLKILKAKPKEDQDVMQIFFVELIRDVVAETIDEKYRKDKILRLRRRGKVIPKKGEGKRAMKKKK